MTLAKLEPRDPLRAALRVRINERNAAQRVVVEAEAALKRASSLLEKRQSVLAKFQNVDEVLATHRLEIEKSFAASGGTAARPVMPPEVIESVRERNLLVEEIESIENGVAALKTDLDNARKALVVSSKKCSRAAGDIIVEMAKAEAELLRSLQEQVWLHTASLRGLAWVWVPDVTGEPRAIALPPEVIKSIDRQETMLPPVLNRETVASKKWKTFHSDLQVDAEACFDSNERDTNR